MLSPAFISKRRNLLPTHGVLNEREDLVPFESDGLAACRCHARRDRAASSGTTRDVTIGL
jgi:hypothetical protein